MVDSHSITPALTPFTFQDHTLSVITDDHGEPWWIAAEVCAALELANTSQAVSRLDADERETISSNDAVHPELKMVIVNESGLYSLILGSRKKVAKEFKRWVTHEVLPQIRKTGKYEAPAVTIPVPTYHAQIDDLRTCASFLHDLGMFEDRDKLMLADMARTALQLQQTPRGGDVLALPAPQGFFLAERVAALGYHLSRKDEASLLASGLARQVAAEYRTRHKEAPRQSQKFVDGAVRPVNWYVHDEAAWIDPMIQAACAHKGFVIIT